jgi:hypothetical protein
MMHRGETILVPQSHSRPPILPNSSEQGKSKSNPRVKESWAKNAILNHTVKQTSKLRSISSGGSVVELAFPRDLGIFGLQRIGHGKGALGKNVFVFPMHLPR